MNTNKKIKNIIEESLEVKRSFLGDKVNIDAISKAAARIIQTYRRGGKLIVFGNGGSAADSQHIAAELIVRFEKERKALPCIALSTNTSIITANANDYSFNTIFSRQLEALANPKDIVIAVSTSGNSENVIEGAKLAKRKGLAVISLTGRDGGKLVKKSDIAIVVRAKNTARIQEIHILVIHILCKLVEDAFSRK